jgi:hypothetical protein
VNECGKYSIGGKRTREEALSRAIGGRLAGGGRVSVLQLLKTDDDKDDHNKKWYELKPLR